MQKQGHPCLENIEHESESGRVELVRVRRDGLLEEAEDRARPPRVGHPPAEAELQQSKNYMYAP